MKQDGPFNVLRNRNAWENNPRAEAIVAALPSALGIGAAGTLSYTLAVAAVSVGLSLVTSWAVAALTPQPPTPKQSLLVNSRDPASPQEFVYGEVRKGGPVTYYETTRGGSVLYQIICLAAHEIESVEAIYVNDKEVTLSNDSYDNGSRSGAGWVTDDEWTDDDTEHEIRIFYHLGDQTAITDTFSNSSTETLDSVFFNTGSSDEDSQNFGGTGQPTKASFVGNGIAYIFVRYAFNSDVFSKGLPLITAKIRGKKVYDPRDTSTAYSNNAALCIRDYITSAYGLNDSQVDNTYFQTAANTCDESVALAAGGTESRYTINGVVRADQSYGEVLQAMTTACAGTLFWGGGEWKLVVGEYTTPTKTLTLDDLRSNITLTTRTNLRDQFNKVQGVFTDAANKFIPTDYPPIESIGTGGFLEQDNNVEQALDLDLPFTTSASMAQRLAKMTLFRGREQMVFSADFGLNAFDVEVGEIIELNMDRYGWSGKDFEVLAWNFNSGDEGDLRVSLTLRETSSAAFSWSAEESEIIANDSDLTRTLDQVTNLTATFDGSVGVDGTFLNGIVVDWDSVAGADGYEVEWAYNDALVDPNSGVPGTWDDYGGIASLPTSPTARELFIFAGYEEILYRSPDQAGFDFYNTGGGSGLTEAAFRAQLAASPEKASITFSGISVKRPTTEYTIKPVLDNTIYNIRVRAYNNFGTKSLWKAVSFDSTADNTIPSAPANLTATSGVASIKLSWDAVTTNTDASAANDIFLYAIYRGTSADPTTLVDTTAGTGWSDVALTGGTTYHYRVTAIDFSGNESGYSANASATPSAGGTPGADGANGDRMYSGRLYYQLTSSTAPSVTNLLNGRTFNESTGEFNSLPSNWEHTQAPVNVSSLSDLEWSIPYTVVVSGSLSFPQTAVPDTAFDLGSVSGAAQVTTDLESDNFSLATGAEAGWKLERDTGNLYANDGIFRGDLVSGAITIGSGGRTFNADPDGSFDVVSISNNSFGDNCLYLLQSANAEALFIQNDSTNSAIHAINDSTANTDSVIYIEHDGAGKGIEIQMDSTGNSDGLRIDTVNSVGGGTGADIENTNGNAGHVQLALGSTDSGYGVYIPATSFRGGLSDGGTGWSPFTGVHLGMMQKGTVVEEGDILVDERVVVTTVSDSFTEVVLSQEVNQKGVIGVYCSTHDNWITFGAFIDKEATRTKAEQEATAARELRKNKREAQVKLKSDIELLTQNFEEFKKGKVSKQDVLKERKKVVSSINKLKEDFDKLDKGEYTKTEPVLRHDPSVYYKDYDLVDINSVGEGAINVCGENGDIQKGDLIVTSSIPGKGMKQTDDIVRGYTVAKAREGVTFTSPDEVKMIACIYLCG